MSDVAPEAPAGAEPSLWGDRVTRLASAMLALPDEHKLSIEAMTSHHFAHRLYAREMNIPAGIVVVGKLHKTRHVIVLLEGEAELITSAGRAVIAAPFFAIGEPGVQRSVLARTDCRFINFHGVEEGETDLARIEAQVIAASPAELAAPAPALAGDI